MIRAAGCRSDDQFEQTRGLGASHSNVQCIRRWDLWATPVAVLGSISSMLTLAVGARRHNGIDDKLGNVDAGAGQSLGDK